MVCDGDDGADDERGDPGDDEAWEECDRCVLARILLFGFLEETGRDEKLPLDCSSGTPPRAFDGVFDDSLLLFWSLPVPPLLSLICLRCLCFFFRLGVAGLGED